MQTTHSTPPSRSSQLKRRTGRNPHGSSMVGGHPTPIADIVADCFPVLQKFQSFSYGPAVALSSAESPWQVSLTRETTQPPMPKLPITVESSWNECRTAV